jgi:UDP:flavonoid glycosyltransferase YjiC (YdhE family)
MGHLTRLLAVARRLPNSIKAVFLTMSQGLSVIHQFGFHAEYVPSHRDTQSDIASWNAWLERVLEQVLEAYSIKTVLYDGNVIYPGICDAVSARANCSLLWIRRGMWREDQDNTESLSSGTAADLIIEPGDIAAEFDSGASTEDRDRVVAIDPIRLLDPHEILPRHECCRKLGLDPERRYVLIQLGAGNNYNFVDLIDNAVSILKASRVAQPVFAQWLTADLMLDLWPDVPRLQCFPISRYYRAFDFTVSAAGYNSFNEIISFGVPSVLVPNLNRAMDDQSARAAYADRHGAAIHLDQEMLPNLDEVLTAMLDESRRQIITAKCLEIARPNGAEEAASLVLDSVAKMRDPS